MRNCLCVCCPTFAAVIGVVILVAGVIITFVVVPPVIREGIIENVILSDANSDQYKRWETLPIPLSFKVYFFNVTNVLEVNNGEIPIVAEMGPYVYRLNREKYDIHRNPIEGTLTYFEREMFDFDTDLSNGLSEEDLVTILHAPLNGVILQAMARYPLAPLVVNNAINTIFNRPTSLFLTATIKEILFTGISLCEDMSGLIAGLICNEVRSSITMRPAADGSLLFSFFNHKNGTHSGLFTIKDGTSDIEDLARIIYWNGNDRLDIWPETGNGESVCNAINGTDASTFPPFFDSPQLQVFNTDICRSVTIHYDGTGTYQGIRGRKYANGPDMLSSDFDCFCVESRRCLKNGAMDLYPCMNSDVVLSLPHFLYADSEYQNGVIGLQPDANIHETFVLLEPNTGSPLQGAKRIQLNMFIEKINDITTTYDITPTLMPVIWIEEGVDLSTELVDMLKDQLINNLNLIERVKLGTLIGGSLAVVIFSVLAVVLYFKCVRPDNALSAKATPNGRSY